MSEVQFAPMKGWMTISGLGRSKSFELLASGDLKAVKVGRRTLIDVQHGLEWLRRQPAARISYGNSDQSKVA